jgi:hypothetical protein
MRRNLNKPANVPKNSAQSLLNRNLNASRSNHGVTNIRTGNNVANSFNILESKSASGKALGGIMKGLAENEALKAAAAERKKRKLGEMEELTTITTNTATLRRLRGLQAIIKRAAGELAKAKTNASKNRASKNLAEAQRAYNSLVLESRPAKVPAVLNKNAIVKSITNANDPVAAYGKFIREHTNLAPNIQKKFIELRNSSMTNANRNYYQTILNTK